MMKQKEVIEGVVRDPFLDCFHVVVMDGEEEVLHPTLEDFKGKRVTITIEEIGKEAPEQ